VIYFLKNQQKAGLKELKDMEEEKEKKEKVKPPRRGSFLPFILVLVIVILFVVFTALYYQKTKETPAGESDKTEEQAKGDVFSAVFLTNGQVYFGYLEKMDTAYPRLTNIYYLQLRNPQPQQANISREEIEKAAEEGVKEEKKEEEAQETTPPAPQQQEEPRLTLVKMGSELHGPIDSMTINKDHILFVEELKEDSKVVQAIREFEAKRAEKEE